MTQLLSLLIFTIQDQIQMIGYYYFADQLTSQSQSVAYYVYDLEWYDQPVKFQKAVRRILERSQQPQCISAGKFFNVSLETYGKFLKMAYTVFTFFRSVTDQK
jgi:odorant receptor